MEDDVNLKLKLILNLDYMIEKNSLFEISKVYNIGLLRYMD